VKKKNRGIKDGRKRRAELDVDRRPDVRRGKTLNLRAPTREEKSGGLLMGRKGKNTAGFAMPNTREAEFFEPSQKGA